MEKMKSALERAMERAEALGKASPEELARLEHLPQGNTLAAKYLREEITDLPAQLSRYDSEVGEYILEGMQATLLGNIVLPRDSRSLATSIKAIQGMQELRGEARVDQEVFDQIQLLFTSYQGAGEQHYLRLKEEFENRLREAATARGQQLGPNVQMDVERLPQFQEEWRRDMAALNAQYEQVLEEHVQRLRVGG